MQACETFLEGVVALREINDQIEELSERESDLGDIDVSSAHLTKEQRAEYVGILRGMAETLSSLIDDKAANSDAMEPVYEFSTDDGEVADLVRLLHARIRAIKRPKRRPIIRKSLLSVCLSDYELLLGTVANFAMVTHPGSADIGDTTLTLSELQSFNSVQDASRSVIDKRVEDLLRSDAAGWEKWFGKFGLNFKETVPDWTGYAEMVARRNVLVHNGGRVNIQYQRTAGVPGVPDHEIGEVLPVDTGYLDSCLQRVSAMGLLLAYSSLVKLLDQTSADRSTDWILNKIDDLIEDGQWSAAAECTVTIRKKTRTKLSRHRELRLQVSNWVARRELGHAEEVMHEVGTWDVSGLEPYYRLARAALLGETEEAQVLLEEQINSGAVTQVSARVNPLFRDL